MIFKLQVAVVLFYTNYLCNNSNVVYATSSIAKMSKTSYKPRTNDNDNNNNVIERTLKGSKKTKSDKYASYTYYPTSSPTTTFSPTSSPTTTFSPTGESNIFEMDYNKFDLDNNNDNDTTVVLPTSSPTYLVRDVPTSSPSYIVRAVNTPDNDDKSSSTIISTMTILPKTTKNEDAKEPTSSPTALVINANKAIEEENKENEESKSTSVSAAEGSTNITADENNKKIGLGMTFGIVLIILLSIFIFVSAHRVIKSKRMNDKISINESYSTLDLDIDYDNDIHNNSTINKSNNDSKNIMQLDFKENESGAITSIPTITTTESILSDLTNTLDFSNKQVKRNKSSLSAISTQEDDFFNQVCNRYCINDGNNNESNNFKIRERSGINNGDNVDIEDNKSVITRASSQYVAEIDNTDSINSHYLYLSRSRRNRELNSSRHNNSNIDDDDTSSKLPETYLL